MFGQPASWQTVCRPSLFTRLCILVYSGPIFARVLIHSGLRSMGVWLLRTSRRSILRPSGATADTSAPCSFDSSAYTRVRPCLLSPTREANPAAPESIPASGGRLLDLPRLQIRVLQNVLEVPFH